MDDNLAARLARIIPRYSMLAEGDGVGVAVSGGADSVVLLHLLHRLAPSLGLRLAVLHVNHRLRGSESDEDEAFVRALAESLGLPCLVARPSLPEGNLEQEARLARRAFFRRCLGEQQLKRIALGHTRSDQAETVLLRLLRGAGLAGLAGMRPVSEEVFIRPLLTTSREEVRSWAAEQHICWREDASNRNLAFARNRLREEVMPILAGHFNPQLEAVLAAVAHVAQDEEAYWLQQIEPIYRQITKRTHWGSILEADTLAGLDPAVQRRVLRRALADVRGDLRSLEIQHVEAILALCSSAHGHDRAMAPGTDALRSFDSLLLTRPGELQSRTRHYRLELAFGGRYELPFGAGSICVERLSPGAPNCANFKEDRELPLEAADLNDVILGGQAGGSIPLAVRNWEPGDRLQRPGHRQPEKIKTLFQEGRVLLWERRHWPVVIAGDEIVWVRQFGPGAKFAASPGSKAQIRITYLKSGG